jgi:uncharacterized membrane protein YhaH (DUF805 family)
MVWCRFPNEYSWRCPHCSTRLKANRSTWLWSGIAVAAIIAVIGSIIALENSAMIAKEKSELYIAIGVAVLVLPVFYLAYRKGGYVPRD